MILNLSTFLFIFISCIFISQPIFCFNTKSYRLHSFPSKCSLHSKHRQISTIKLFNKKEVNDFETEDEGKEWTREWMQGATPNQIRLEEDILKLEARMEKDEKRFETIVELVYKILPILSIMLSIAGISFQVFVLYPWHEELSYEFKSLETAIISLDERIENSKFTDFNNLKRPTDVYAKTIKSKTAGPVISDMLPFFKELNALKTEE